MLQKILAAILSVFTLIASLFTGMAPVRTKLRLAVPNDWELSVGDSRTVDAVFSETVANRRLTWTAEPDTVAAVDEWGRVTARAPGTATITAAGDGIRDSITLRVVETPTQMQRPAGRVDYQGEPAAENPVLQKFVTRFAWGDPAIPSFVTKENAAAHQSAATADGAVWQITEYGMLRSDSSAANARDRVQRLMGDRYFYESDTTDGRVLAVYPDGENGVWTCMDSGVTHIAILPMSGAEKAVYLSGITQANNLRHGFAAESYATGNGRTVYETDNDGLWTGMYGAGELLHYAILRADAGADPAEIAAAKQAAYSASEAVLMLFYISMRSGTVESYVRFKEAEQRIPGSSDDRMLSARALKAGGDPSVLLPAKSPADSFQEAVAGYRFLNSPKRLENQGYYVPVTPDDWADPASEPGEYAKQTRLLAGFPCRTFSLKSEPSVFQLGGVHWAVNADGTATFRTGGSKIDDHYLNGEELQGVTVDASAPVPARLWNDVIGAEHTVDEIYYKTDTSADELVGDVFLLKLMFDILGPEDAELRALIVQAIDRLAQHLTDNSYMLVDATGQPATWSNFSRWMLSAGSSVAEAPLHAMVLLSVFKTAAYITGYEKWENEYRFAAEDPAYEYAKVTAQQYERMIAAAEYTIGDATAPPLANLIDLLKSTNLMSLVYKSFANYSAEEMAMLTFYTLFQLETDPALIKEYRAALDDWWITAGDGENPLWYLIYQLANPDKPAKDAFGNRVLETAAWSLSRHPTDLSCYIASNDKRDDLGQFSLAPLGLKVRNPISYDKRKSPALPALSEKPETAEIIRFALAAAGLRPAVAAPDERALHKYNSSTYTLEGYHSPGRLETCTTYTLSYWLGVYHSMLTRA